MTQNSEEKWTVLKAKHKNSISINWMAMKRTWIRREIWITRRRRSKIREDGAWKILIGMENN